MLFNIEEKFSLSRRDQPPARLFRGFKGGAFGGASLNCINFVVPMNIATTKLIQCGIAEMPENKVFHGFCGFIFSFYEPFSRCGSSSVFGFCTTF